MSKLIIEKVRTVCLDPAEPLAREYPNEHAKEIVTVQDVGMSLFQMVSTGTVGVVRPASDRYSFSGYEDDDEAHDNPDFMKLNDADMTEKAAYVESFVNDQKNYEKKEVQPEVVEAKEQGSEAGETSDQK